AEGGRNREVAVYGDRRAKEGKGSLLAETRARRRDRVRGLDCGWTGPPGCVQGPAGRQAGRGGGGGKTGFARKDRNARTRARGGNETRTPQGREGGGDGRAHLQSGQTLMAGRWRR